MKNSRYTETQIVKILTEVEAGRKVNEVCGAVGISDSTYRYRQDHHRWWWGHCQATTSRRAVSCVLIWQIIKILKCWGTWNHKRVYRVHCSLKLNILRKGKKRLPKRAPAPLVCPERINSCWSIDFMSDALVCGRRFRTFNAVDDF